MRDLRRPSLFHTESSRPSVVATPRGAMLNVAIRSMNIHHAGPSRSRGVRTVDGQLADSDPPQCFSSTIDDKDNPALTKTSSEIG